jgi:hypothetical protein
MIFRGNEHKVIYTSLIKRVNKPIFKMSPEFLSSLYLLTSYTKLWSKAKHAIESEKIDFSKICLKNINPDCYVLCKVAQDVYEGTDHISFSDLTDSESINERIYKLILSEGFSFCSQKSF